MILQINPVEEIHTKNADRVLIKKEINVIDEEGSGSQLILWDKQVQFANAFSPGCSNMLIITLQQALLILHAGYKLYNGKRQLYLTAESLIQVNPAGARFENFLSYVYSRIGKLNILTIS